MAGRVLCHFRFILLCHLPTENVSRKLRSGKTYAPRYILVVAIGCPSGQTPPARIEAFQKHTPTRLATSSSINTSMYALTCRQAAE